jgi:hypothetical protein
MKATNQRFSLLFACLLIIRLLNAQIYCDNSLKPKENDTLCYKDRGNNRCEGFYQGKISGGLQIVSLVRGSFNFQKVIGEKISIICPGYKSYDVHIRVQAIPMKTYYRMDGRILPGETFLWPLDDVIIHVQSISSADLGLVGYVNESGGNVYIPLQAKSNKVDKNDKNDLHIIFRSTVDVKLLQYKVLNIKDKNINKEWIPLGFSSQYAGKPIIICPPLTEPGKYWVILSGQEKYSGNWIDATICILIPD